MTSPRIALWSLALAALVSWGGPSLAGMDKAPQSRREGISNIVGQMLIVGFTGTDSADSGVKSVARQISTGQIGGVILLARNIVDPTQTKTLTKHLKDAAWLSGRPAPLISVDQEGGRVQRLDQVKGFEAWASAETVAELFERYGEAFALEYYGQRARMLSELGLNMNLGPVIDLDVNPNNPIIGRLGRSFSNDPDVVSTVAGDFVVAHRSTGILTSLKHFPGHGSSTTDSHKTLPRITDSWSALELEPYESLARRGLIDTIMLSHVYHPDYSDDDNVPTSLSARAVEAARDISGDDIPIISDDMQMDAVTARFSEREALLRAVEAGVDLVIYSTFEQPDPQIGTRLNGYIVDAVETGQLDLNRILRSYRRIVALKAQF